MSDYERKQWQRLNEHWGKKDRPPRAMPHKVSAAATATQGVALNAAAKTSRGMSKVAPQKVKDASAFIADRALEPAIRALVGTLDYLVDVTDRLHDPEKVLRYHRKQGHDVTSLEDLSTLDLKDLDKMTRHMVMKWRTTGLLEGGTLGALTLIPVPGLGSSLAITADLVVTRILIAGIATRIAYAYGYDARDPDQAEMIVRMVRRSYAGELIKARTLRDSAAGWNAAKGRQRWSQKLRDDHRILDAMEKLMKHAGKTDAVPVATAAKGLPALSIITGAGLNAMQLADVAKQAAAYAQTNYLADKYNLPLPAPLTSDTDLAMDTDPP